MKGFHRRRQIIDTNSRLLHGVSSVAGQQARFCATDTVPLVPIEDLEEADLIVTRWVQPAVVSSTE